MKVLVATRPRGGPWPCDARSSLMGAETARKLPISALLNPDQAAP
ncbi:hypothetical protein GCM10009678_41180 [Actinomadura kijaniata]|uniref:Uncharacterized protein n=1 Tax=Actinomadura namibiensis TaxID=182080 RepID=A0A7W3LM94_ACTNM|nr:hypothetical protein [Actinomadura namibiensis]